MPNMYKIVHLNLCPTGMDKINKHSKILKNLVTAHFLSFFHSLGTIFARRTNKSKKEASL